MQVMATTAYIRRVTMLSTRVIAYFHYSFVYLALLPPPFRWRIAVLFGGNVFISGRCNTNV